MFRYVLAVFIISLFVLSAFLAGFLGHEWLLGRSASPSPDTEEEFSIFWEAWNIAERNFVDTNALDPQVMTYGAIRGMLDALGDRGHTRFLSPEELKAEEMSIRGRYSGIGAEIGIRDGVPVIVAPLDGSPAQEAGIRAGDIVVRVDGEDVTGFTLDQVVALVRGPEGEPVTLTLIREGQSAFLEITVVRQTIRIASVSWTVVPGTSIAHIRISQFNEVALPDLLTALKEIRQQNVTGIVVDVRSNPGGLLDQAVDIASQFLESGNVVLERSRSGAERAYKVKPGGLATDIPVVVLVNQGSASASEIFAGAIQDQQRGTIVGETTFGTGTILSTFYLSDGSAILLGTGEWLTPNGRSLRAAGVTPNVEVPLPDDGRILTPTVTASLTLEEIRAEGDEQLARGIELLLENAPVTMGVTGLHAQP